MAAAKPSSVVGWPVVGPKGRMIANVAVINKKPENSTDEAFAEYYAEVEANARLIAAAPALLDAIKALKTANGGEDFTQWHESFQPAISLMRAAIHKAESL